MKVICIDARNSDGNPNIKCPLVEGDIYEADYSYNCGPHNCCVLIKEIGVAFKKNRFAPVSDIDETEFIRNYNKQLS